MLSNNSELLPKCSTPTHATCRHAWQVDAFTTTAFAGNAAAVCLLPRAALPLGDALRQRIAAEMNLSETAFLEVAGDGIGDDWRGAGRFRLRWFTPAVEVPLCGHATLAAAAALLKGAALRTCTAALSCEGRWCCVPLQPPARMHALTAACLHGCVLSRLTAAPIVRA